MAQVENEVGVVAIRATARPPPTRPSPKPCPRSSWTISSSTRTPCCPSSQNLGSRRFQNLGTWTDVFGPGVATTRSSWPGTTPATSTSHRAGKAAYPSPCSSTPGQLASDKGRATIQRRPQAHNHDIWRAGAPHVDMLTPDIYMPNFPELAARYSRSGNPLFIPDAPVTSTARPMSFTPSASSTQWATPPWASANCSG